MKILLFSLGNSLKIHEGRSKIALKRSDNYAGCKKKPQKTFKMGKIANKDIPVSLLSLWLLLSPGEITVG